VIVETVPNFKLILIGILLSGCSAASEVKLGFWVDEKPYRGTLEKNRNNIKPYWQCVENFTPYKNKEC